MNWFVFLYGMVTGAALFGRCRWALWAMGCISGFLALASALDGDWLWTFVLSVAAWVWMADARRTVPA